MLAVMTMNSGYFISVLSGVFLGMFLLGNSADGNVADDRWHQC
jgi:solute carrier family 31 (copper transporter), member 1